MRPPGTACTTTMRSASAATTRLRASARVAVACVREPGKGVRTSSRPSAMGRRDHAGALARPLGGAKVARPAQQQAFGEVDPDEDGRVLDTGGEHERAIDLDAREAIVAAAALALGGARRDGRVLVGVFARGQGCAIGAKRLLEVRFGMLRAPVRERFGALAAGRFGIPPAQPAAIRVPEVTGGHHDEVVQPPDTEAAKRDGHEGAGSGLADIEAVGPEGPQEGGEGRGDPPGLFGGVRRSEVMHGLNISGNRGGVHGHERSGGPKGYCRCPADGGRAIHGEVSDDR